MSEPSDFPATGGRPEDLPHTTERVTIEEYMDSEGGYVIYSLHAATYAFALSYVKGHRVLDLGCGTGYGTEVLAQVAAEVVGVDVSGEAIVHATARFAKENLEFRQIGRLPEQPLPFEDGLFDVVTSFQVIEHIEAAGQYLDEVQRVLAPDGVFLCVTPDRTHRLLSRQKPWNEFHCTEYRPDELAALLGTRFTDVTVLGMTAPDHMIKHELRRYRRMRTLAYPFTFPGAPEWWRVFGLRLAKRLARRERPRTSPGAFGFGPDDVIIASGAHPSVNIVALASGTCPRSAPST